MSDEPMTLSAARLVLELRAAREDLRALESYWPVGHPWSNICGTQRGDHSWCQARLERARERVVQLEQVRL